MPPSEVAYIKSLPNRVVHTVDLEAEPSVQLHAIEELSRWATVFLERVTEDWKIIMPIRDALLAAEYRAWSIADIKPGERFDAAIDDEFSKAIRDGFVLLFVSAGSLANWGFRKRIRTILNLAAKDPHGRGRIIPVILPGRPVAFESLPVELRDLRVLDLSSFSPTEAGTRLIRHLRQKLKRHLDYGAPH